MHEHRAIGQEQGQECRLSTVSAADLKAVKTALAAFARLQPKPRQSKATSAAATRELETLFTTLDEVLNNQIDPLTEKFRESDATFYNEYQTVAPS